jgi:hypothetical protein
MDGAFGLMFVIPNGTFRPRHELLLLLPELDLLLRRHASALPMSDAERMAPDQPVAACPRFSPELDNGEEHCKIMVKPQQWAVGNIRSRGPAGISRAGVRKSGVAVSWDQVDRSGSINDEALFYHLRLLRILPGLSLCRGQTSGNRYTHTYR